MSVASTSSLALENHHIERGKEGWTHLDSCKHYTAVCVLELRCHPLADMFCLLLVRGPVLCYRRQDRYPSPLGALAQSDQEFSDESRVELEYRPFDPRILRCRFFDLCQCGDGICDDLVCNTSVDGSNM